MPKPITGQVAVSAAAAPLTAVHVDVTAWTLKAPGSNAFPVFVGNSAVTASTGHQYDPGDTFEYERYTQNGQPKYEISPDDVYVVGTPGDKVTWFGSPGGVF
jgi:hypothetical protein